MFSVSECFSETYAAARAKFCAAAAEAGGALRSWLNPKARGPNGETLYLDTSGDALFKRGWREDKGEAPLKETLAAAMIAASGWDATVPLYDPCCGSGGMFVQSVKFVTSHSGNQKDISIYGQEQTSTTYKLAKMNLAIHGIEGKIIENHWDYENLG